MQIQQTERLSGTLAQSPARRFWEIDALRGVAIIMMVIFHLMWDLWFFRVLPDLVLYAGFWKYFQRVTANLFILLVGVSLTISYRRASRGGGGGPGLFQKFLRRGMRIFAWGMVISLVVAALGIGQVHFGILHLIGFSVAAAYPFLERRWLNLALWALFNVAGYVLLSVRVSFPWLVWLGVEPYGYGAVDYFPIVPWFGVVLLGIFVGNTFYTGRGRQLPLPEWGGSLPVRWLSFLGRHSLTIYLLHQPALFLLMVLLGIAPLPF
ncbi:DUF1624 domain-containing protein [Litorilinea aerophila]|uniref:DUF1624 domain-containing protein n=1 Tax=Litorilinea aerophila TaxID=1204385 RepID=A0A540VJU5_9CHLR|nr:heparan-alpha-glucosaminide N-acetyltransferase [Litorilinea aerophila]MCC9075510.1 DUF1624 domain-containing protein [Litorilinea aerophila]GIV76396.1 MAG: membrane protein [Litorilinea sp.]